MSQNDSRKTLRSLFCDELYDYVYIPRIQRDYAQGRRTEEAKVIRENILDDVSSGKPLSWGIVFGVSEYRDMEDGFQKKCFIPIDGQQRLTTLFLLNLYGAKHHKIDFDFLHNFNYETRNASRDFIETLVDNWDGDKILSSLKEHIINQGWFLNYWLLDPTVDAVLNMLTSIDNRFSQNKKVFENLDRISFEFLDLKSLDLNETLYLKMNSRGRKLSQFDKIKSEFDKILSKSDVDINACDFNLYADSHLNSLSTFADKWRYCIDRKWSDLFWDKSIHNFDVAFIAFIVNYLVAGAGKDYEYADKLLNIEFADSEFFLPWKYIYSYLMVEDNCHLFLKNIASILNKIIYNLDKSPDVVRKLIRRPANYPERAIQYGLLLFAGSDYSSIAFREWERFVYNYATNTVDDKETFFAFTKRIKDEFYLHSNDILAYLASKYDCEKYDREQLNEEYFKAYVILNRSDLTKTVRESEKHPLLNGRIRPLIADSENYNADTFVSIWNNFINWFGEDGKALQFADNLDSLSRRVIFATAFTKSLTRMNQLYDGIKCLDFSGTVLRDKLQQQRFEPIFRRCLLCEDLANIKELPWFNPDEIEGIQTKATLLQKGVIKGILKHNGGETLRFSWYHNCPCFYPYRGQSNDWRIGFDRINYDPEWTRNRNHVLSYLKNKGYKVLDKPVTEDDSIALWWGSDIRFIDQQHSKIILFWDAYYNIGIVREDNTWIKRKMRKEGKNENYLFYAVKKNAEQIEIELNNLISEYIEETSEKELDQK